MYLKTTATDATLKETDNVTRIKQ